MPFMEKWDLGVVIRVIRASSARARFISTLEECRLSILLCRFAM